MGSELAAWTLTRLGPSGQAGRQQQTVAMCSTPASSSSSLTTKLMLVNQKNAATLESSDLSTDHHTNQANQLYQPPSLPANQLVSQWIVANIFQQPDSEPKIISIQHGK